MKELIRIRDLISQNKTSEAFDILKNIVKDNPIIDDIIIRNASFNELERSIIRGTVSQDEVTKQKNQINNALLKIIRIIEGSFKQREQRRRYILGIVVLVMIVGVISFVLFNFYKKLSSPDVVLIGSGSVYKYMQRNVFRTFDFSFPRIVPLESPSKVGMKVLANAFQEADSISSKNKTKNLPHLIGMVSFELADTIKFTLDSHDPERRYYALQIGKDELLAIVGGKNYDEIRKFTNKTPTDDFNSTETLEIDSVQLIIEKARKKHLITTVEDSGTYTSWNNALLKNGNDSLPKNKLFYYTDSQESKDYVAGLEDFPWISLGSDYYNIGSIKKCCSLVFKIRGDNGEIIGRPLYLIGILPKEKRVINGKDVYIIKNRTVYEFWKQLLNELSDSEDIKNHIDLAQKEFIIDLGNNELGIIHQAGAKKIEIYRLKKK